MIPEATDIERWFISLFSKALFRCAPAHEPGLSTCDGQHLIISVSHASLLATQAAWAAQPPALPSGGSFAAGSGTIVSSGNAVTINQASNRGIIDWHSFSIGQGGLVTFHNGSGATLNRVTGGAMSSILGNLNATGSVYLINPEGVLIGPNGVIHTGGDFVASTLNISPSLFLAGKGLVFEGNSSAVVKNLGSVFSGNGSVFLIARSVENQGQLHAPAGTVGLAAGQSILLKESGSDERMFVRATGGDVVNAGTIAAAEAELKAAGGNIYALAGNQGGQISATGTAKKDGHVWLIAEGGTTTVSSHLWARNADGQGGTIETSGAHVQTAGASIQTGQGGTWLLDPVDLTIDASAATTIQNTLNAGTNVTEQTTSSGSSGAGSIASGNRDINVASNITWNGSAALTLSAYRNININSGKTISNTGAGNLVLRADNASTGTDSLAITTET